jgi:hypothetical protein
LSVAYIDQHRVNCFMLLMQFALCAFILALVRAGKSMLARIAIMAITTNNSMSVKPWPSCSRRLGAGIGE